MRVRPSAAIIASVSPAQPGFVPHPCHTPPVSCLTLARSGLLPRRFRGFRPHLADQLAERLGCDLAAALHVTGARDEAHRHLTRAAELAQLTGSARQMLRPSFVPPPQIRRLRDLTRYRADLVRGRTAEKQRAEKLLEDAQIKLSVVATDIFGVSGRDMMAALVAGERNPKVLAQLARRTLRKKIILLEEAFTGHFTDHSRVPARPDARPRRCDQH